MLPHPSQLWLAVLIVLTALSATSGATDAGIQNYQQQMEADCRQAEAAWHAAGSPGEDTEAGAAMVRAGIDAWRPDLVERVLAVGIVHPELLPISRGGRRIPLRVAHRFTGFPADLPDEMYSSIRNRDEGWLARRITDHAVEVWTPTQGWLFDGHGRLRHTATPPRGTGHGREWYGAFLPDGLWVTTELDAGDSHLSFFSATGKLRRTLTCDQLAPRPADDERMKLLGWGRSDRRGAGWVVNVGSEGGWAAVWVGPNGPARVLKKGESWSRCYPRALGPRGMYTFMQVPDDRDRFGLEYAEPAHGPHVGYPVYERVAWNSPENGVAVSHTVPAGNEVFGFWPHSRSYFIGAEGTIDGERRFARLPPLHPHPDPSETARKFLQYDQGAPEPIIDKTWFFNASGKVLACLRARRIGDAADGRSLLFRVTADSRILTLGPDLRVRAIRKLIWSDGATADAVILWDDLRLGLFIQEQQLILASWDD